MYHWDTQQLGWSSKHDVHVCMLSHFSHVWLFVTLWTVACQAPLSMEFPRQEDWSGLPCAPPGDLRDPEIEPESLISPGLAGDFFTTSAASEACCCLVAKRVQLCDPMDCSLPDASVHGILQARVLGWAAISFCRRSSRPRNWTHISCICRQILYHGATWDIYTCINDSIYCNNTTL